MKLPVSWFFEINVYLVIVCALSLAGLLLLRRIPSLGARAMLKYQYALIIALILLPFLGFPEPATTAEPAARIWSSGSMSEIHTPSDQGRVVSVSLPARVKTGQYTLSFMETLILFALLAGVLVFAVRVAQSLRNQRRLLREAWQIRRVGRVQIWASHISVPISFRLPGRKIVVLPVSLCNDADGWQPALRHELQHHRQGDTLMVYVLCALKYGFFWNPAAHLLARIVSELQEYACDEALVANSKVSPQAYGRCLLQVATLARTTHAFPIGAVGMVATSASGRLLKRRINMILTPRKTGVFSHVFAAAVFLLMFGAAYAANGMIRDQRIDADLARELVAHANAESDFNLTLNQGVLEELNRYAGTPDGRAWMQESLRRMEAYRPLLEETFQKYNLPDELMALPILESGYRNLNPNRRKPHAAGLWQFIPGTARNFNLEVSDKTDERLVPELATDAAARLLSALHLQYQDWNLALMAYNAGSGKVNRQIKTTGTRDAWLLLEENDFVENNYLHKAIAMIIIMKNPHILD